MQEESLRKQEESVKKQEAIRKATIEHELQLRHKYDLERIEAEVRAKTKAARENRDVNLEMTKASEEESRKTMVERIRTTGSVLGTGLNEFISDNTKVLTTVGALSALAVGMYTAKRGTGVVSKYVEARLGRPSLVRETSRLSIFEFLKHPMNNMKMLFRKAEDPLTRVVLNVGSLHRKVGCCTSQYSHSLVSPRDPTTRCGRHGEEHQAKLRLLPQRTVLRTAWHG